MEDLLMPVLPEDTLIDIFSRLSAKVVCKLKCLSKSWLSFISTNSEFNRLHRLRAPPILVIAKVINEDYSSPGLFIEEAGDFGGRKVVFNSKLRLGYLQENVASCRDLVCFYNGRDMYAYSPSTNQYLAFKTPVSSMKPHDVLFAIVYVASMKLYRIVKLEFYRRSPHRHLHLDSPPTIRFKAITLQEEEAVGGGNKHRKGTCSWELISEHAMPTNFIRQTGNLIGVNGVVYTIIRLSDVDQRQVISLGFADKRKFKMFDLPQASCDSGNCHRYCTYNISLSQVKDVLCFPHPTTSAIDLWLLRDRDSCTWFKGYTISYIPPPYCLLGDLVYFTTTADDDDAGSGVCIFSFGGQVLQYDIRTKQSTYLFQDEDNQRLLLFSDYLRPLKNGLTCTRVHSPERKRKTMMPHPTPPQGSFPPPPPPPLPPYYNHNMLHTPCSPELKRGAPRHPLPQRSLPPPPNKPHNLQHGIYSQEFKKRIPLPLPPYSHPPLPQSSHPLPPSPPLYSHPPPPQDSLRPPLPPPHSNPLPRRGSLPPPLYYPQNLQHIVCSPESNRRMANPPLPRGLPPPPPHYPHNLQLNINSSELKRRKLDS